MKGGTIAAALLGLHSALATGAEPMAAAILVVADSRQRLTTTEVRAEVDRESYRAGERILVTLVNPTSACIYSTIQSGTPAFAIRRVQRRTAARQPDGSWEELDPHCTAPACTWDIDAPGEIRPNETAAFSWIPVFVAKGTRRALPLGTGRYRLEIGYQDRRNGPWLSVFTNEFGIE